MGAPGSGCHMARSWWLRFLNIHDPVAKLGNPGIGLGSASGAGDLGSSAVGGHWIWCLRELGSGCLDIGICAPVVRVSRFIR